MFRTKSDALKNGDKVYHSYTSCPHGHKEAVRTVSTGNCVECSRKYTRDWYDKNRDNPAWQKSRMFKALKNRALRSGKEFSIEESDIDWPTHCPILRIPLVYGGDTTKDRNNSYSFDRIDNSKGYVKGNVRVISMKANSLKSDSTIEELERVILYMHGVI